MKVRRLLVLVLLLAAVPMWAQFSPNSSPHSVTTLRIDVVYANGGRATSGVRVQLMQGLATTMPVDVVMTNSSGSAEFRNLIGGDYRVEVSGEGIETTQSNVIHIESTRVFESQMVAVRRTGEGTPGDAKGNMGKMVSVAELNVPKEASKELARGDIEMQHNNWKKAAEHFSKAASIYPQYASAYYNLSAAYLRLGKSDAQRDALQEALKVNEKFVPALVSLAHLELADHKPEQARRLLDTAILADPNNVEGLALRVRVAYLQGQDQQVIADAQKVHEMPHSGYATVHYTAAGSFQRMNRIPEMLAQLQLFLQEDPKNQLADYVRQTIAEMQDQSR